MYDTWKYNYNQNILLMEFIILPSFYSLKQISGHHYAGKVTLGQIVLIVSKRNCSAGKCHILSEITVPK